ncbi:hypothetical protein DPMN_101933 [Dreissena polymorpha]|uniref:Uncharacterized protein n=1 Tax=Dreissena polymorpha TaxID=45954 RepID=A0A9D4RA52_DREPO|nr:hypothetical protein DPMN_101933 [Dreissena polymorpha]
MEKSVRNQLLNHYECYFDEDNKDLTSMRLKLLTWFRMRYSTKVGSNRVLFLKMIEATQGLASHPESRAAFTETTSHPDNVFKWMRMNFPQLNTRKCRRTTHVCSNENDIVVEELEDGYCSTSNNCRPELQIPMASDFSFIYNSLSEICLKPKREPGFSIISRIQNLNQTKVSCCRMTVVVVLRHLTKKPVRKR